MNTPHNLIDGEIGQQFAIYLNDHRAGAEGAEALASRCARADHQLERLEALHRWATSQAFDGSTTKDDRAPAAS